MAVSPVKVLYRTETIVENTVTYQGRVISRSNISRLSIAQTSAGRSRPKPPFLLPTVLSYDEVKANAKVYERDAQGFIRKGTLAHVYNTTVISSKSQKSSDGSAAMARARSKVSEFNFGETLVEFADTSNLISKRLGQFVRLFRDLRSGKWKALESRGLSISKDLKSVEGGSKRVASGYLEIQFGWMPIISDIHSAIEAYGRNISEKGSTIKTRSGNTRPARKADQREFFDDSAPMEASASYGGTVSNVALFELNRLGLANPALMAWNKMPLSFLVDWFLPISPILGSLTSGLGLSGLRGCIVTRSLNTTKQQSAPGLIYGQTYSALRTPSTSIIGVPLDNKGIAMRVGQVATAVALARQILMK